MVDEKKFLDQAGIQYLWSQLSLEDYPNNETLIAVLNAIDTTKADKDDIKQSDWDENDSTSAAYIQNRTHYDYSGNVFTQEVNLNYLDNMGIVVNLYGTLEEDMNFPLVEGYSYNVNIEIEGLDTFISKNNVCFNYDDNGSLAIGDPSLFQEGPSLLITDGVQRFVYGQINGNYILRLSESGLPNQASVIAKITIEENAFLKTLDEKFIPDTIARKEYVDVLNDAVANKADKDDIVQSDWNQYDETALDYVKNRTHWMRPALALLNSEIFECSTLASDETSYYSAKSGNIGLVEGQEYNVIVNGTSYTLEAKAAFGTNDIALIADVDECRIYDRESGFVEVFTDASRTLTITIKETSDTYKQLDEKFIPDVFARSLDVELKMDKENPTGTGAFSMNRATGSEIGENSIAIGTDCIASGASAVAIGSGASAIGFASHAEGNGAVAEGDLAHAEGQDSLSSGFASHAESSSEANGDYSHAEGYGIADGNYSHASGNGTWAIGRSQTVIGEANYEDEAEDAATRGTYAVIVGNGNIDENEYSNAATLDWSGNVWFAGDVYVGSTEGINKDDGSLKLATENLVNTKQDKNLIVTKGSDGLATHSPAEILEAVKNGVNVYYTTNINSGTLHPYLESSNQTSYFHSNYIDNSRVVATGFLIDSNKNVTVSNYSALDNYYNKTEVDSFHETLETYVDDQVAALVNAAPETLDTLGELATAFQENKEVVDVLNEAITNKYSADNPPPYPVTSVQGQTGDVVFITETWTFTLADGTVITKQVLIG